MLTLFLWVNRVKASSSRDAAEPVSLPFLRLGRYNISELALAGLSSSVYRSGRDLRLVRAQYETVNISASCIDIKRRQVNMQEEERAEWLPVALPGSENRRIYVEVVQRSGREVA